MVRMAWPPFPADFLPTVALGLEVKGFGKGLHRESRVHRWPADGKGAGPSAALEKTGTGAIMEQ